jgi:hypothetical protein
MMADTLRGAQTKAPPRNVPHGICRFRKAKWADMITETVAVPFGTDNVGMLEVCRQVVS